MSGFRNIVDDLKYAWEKVPNYVRILVIACGVIAAVKYCGLPQEVGDRIIQDAQQAPATDVTP